MVKRNKMKTKTEKQWHGIQATIRPAAVSRVQFIRQRATQPKKWYVAFLGGPSAVSIETAVGPPVRQSQIDRYLETAGKTASDRFQLARGAGPNPSTPRQATYKTSRTNTALT